MPARFNKPALVGDPGDSPEASLAASADLFHVSVRHEDGGVVVALDGELDLLGAPQVHAVLLPFRHRYDAEQITLDCAGLTFIDASGYASLLHAAKSWGLGHRMRLLDPAPAVRQALELFDADAWFALDDGHEIDLTDRSASHSFGSQVATAGH